MFGASGAEIGDPVTQAEVRGIDDTSSVEILELGCPPADPINSFIIGVEAFVHLFRQWEIEVVEVTAFVVEAVSNRIVVCN